MTIRDNVDAVYQLLTDGTRVKHLRAVVGFSMGAEQAFQWAVSHPDFADASSRPPDGEVVATASSGWKGRSPRSPPIPR